MNNDKMQASRFELKYVVSEDTAQQIRGFVQPRFELDEYGIGQPDFAYPVHSVYVDSDDMKTYWDAINGNKSRFKLRIRFYSDQAEAPVFFEIKRRMNDCNLKRRGGVRREAVPSILSGQMPPPEALVSTDPEQVGALQDFCRLVEEMQARPKVHVAYAREAYLPAEGNAARLTLDRLVRSEPHSETQLSTRMRNPILVWGKAVVLELKFTNRYPDWFGDLVGAFGLQQCGAAKYADAVTLMSGHLPQHRNMPQPNPDLHWPLANEFSPGRGLDHVETPSPQSVTLAVEDDHRPAETASAELKGRP